MSSRATGGGPTEVRRALELRRRRILWMAQAGLSPKAIADGLGVGAGVVREVLKAAGLPIAEEHRNGRPEARRMDMEEQQYSATARELEETRERVRTFAGTIFKGDGPELARERHDLLMGKLSQDGTIRRFAAEADLDFHRAYRQLSQELSLIARVAREEARQRGADIVLLEETGISPIRPEYEGEAIHERVKAVMRELGTGDYRKAYAIAKQRSWQEHAEDREVTA